jgi:hypothetical protein
MRINIKLQYIKGVLNNESIIERITKDNNADYLVKGEDNKEFQYLAQVEIDDYSVYWAENMDGLIEELLRVRQEVSDPADQEHIDDIIRLAKKCKETPGTVLTFAG